MFLLKPATWTDTKFDILMSLSWREGIRVTLCSALLSLWKSTSHTILINAPYITWEQALIETWTRAIIRCVCATNCTSKTHTCKIYVVVYTFWNGWVLQFHSQFHTQTKILPSVYEDSPCRDFRQYKKNCWKFYSYNITRSAQENTYPTHLPLETQNKAIVANSNQAFI